MSVPYAVGSTQPLHAQVPPLRSRAQPPLPLSPGCNRDSTGPRLVLGYPAPSIVSFCTSTSSRALAQQLLPCMIWATISPPLHGSLMRIA
eukprot:2247584-Amphidinium_carterae.1